MDSIKFRAWDKTGRVMVDWLTMRQTAFNRREHQLLYKILVNHSDNFDVMQFTGIQDKGGQDAYEGDIVDTWPFYKYQGNCKGKNRYQKIIFEYGAFMVQEFDFGWEGEGTIRIENCTIIGNVYTHSHVLNSEQKSQECDATGDHQGTEAG